MKRGPMSPEHKARISAAMMGKNLGKTLTTPQRESLSAALKGRHHGQLAKGFWVDSTTGYTVLSMMYDHPLAHSGDLLEHRKVLWEKLGCQSLGCEHPCEWCGEVLVWGGGTGICSDHLDDDPSNNDPNNLVVSCRDCNRLRGQHPDSPRYNRGVLQ